MPTYKQSGVNIEAGDEFVRRIKAGVRSTFSPAVLTDIGAFGAFYSARFTKYRSPVLVSSTDGVGTKLKLAIMMDKHDTIGQDLVNHCVNDIAVCGAKPLFFLDYFAVGKLDLSVAEQIIRGLVIACKENSCSLIGGETAEMPAVYKQGDYDLAGTIVGVAEKRQIVNGKKIKAGDVLIGLPSTGLHTNGYSLARKVLFPKFKHSSYIPDVQSTLGEALLAVHRSYLKPIRLLMKQFPVRGFAHITGGGIIGNTSRIIPEGMAIEIDWKAWEVPVLFRLIQKTGSVPESDMRKTFNLGIGLVLVVPKTSVSAVLRFLKTKKENPVIIGSVIKRG